MSQHTQDPQGSQGSQEPDGREGRGGQDLWTATGSPRRRPKRVQPTQGHGSAGAFPQEPFPQGAFPQGPFPQAAQPPSHGRPQQARNGLGIAALALGLVGALSGLVPVLFWLAGVLGLLGLILGLAGRGRAKRGDATNKAVATIGALLGLVAMIVAVIGAVITFKAVGDAVGQIDRATAGSSASVKPGADAEAPSKSDGGGADKAAPGSKDKPLAAGDTAVYDDDLNVTIGAAQPYAPDDFAIGHTTGKHAYKVTVTIENKGSKKYDATLTTVAARAGADGREAEAIFDNTVGEGFSGQVLPGRKATAVYAFDAPADARTLTVQFSPGLSYNETQWDLRF
jgi:hypothetical protein